LGITTGNVNDLAFLGPEIIQPSLRFPQYQIAPERFVVLAPSRSFGQLESQVECFSKIVPYLRSQGIQPILFTSVTNTRIGDKRIAKRINKVLKSNSQQSVSIIRSENQLIQTLTKSCFVVTARMHAAIIALSSHVPVFVLEYQGKVGGLMEDLNLEEFFTDIPVISEGKINRLISDQVKYKKILAERIPLFKSRAENLMNEILKTN
jgi:polysaccharide pyruvyl transferase WcaK-like protein